MLTKDLLRVRVSGASLKPQFIPEGSTEWLELSSGLLNLYENGCGSSAGLLDDSADALTLRHKDIKLARGLKKIVRDRAVFSGAADEFTYTENRAAVFQKMNAMLKEGTLPADARSVRDCVYPDVRELYADLPENEKLIRFKKTYPQEVLDRYNVALVQTLLLTANSLELTIPADTPSADLRNLFRSLKFFRLLFSGGLTAKRTIQLTVDGPASILENSQKYGLQLACFFPAVCRLDEWKLTASVSRNGKNYRLNLDQKTGLKSYRAQFSGPIEEHRMFLDFFKVQQTGWEIDDAPGYLVESAQKVIFPDFSFENEENGETVYLELFHRWHASQLEERLASPPEKERLIIGVDRSLLKKDGILKAKLEDNSYFRKNGFLFRDFPGMENVLKVLRKQE